MNTVSPLFSIVVPIYKTEPYLHRCVDSLLSQSFSDIEIILVDDESPDRAPEICDAYAAAHSCVKVIHKANGGLSDARNCGIHAACGEYIIFVDSDDYIAPDTYARFAKYARNGYDILIGDAIVEGGICNLSHIQTTDVLSGEEYLLRSFSAGNAPMAAWLNVYKKDFLLKNDLFFKKGILHEDEEFTPRCLLKANSVVCTGIPFYHYIIRDNSITTQKDKRKNASDLFDTCVSLKQIYTQLNNRRLKKYLINSLAAKYLSIFQVGRLHQYGNKYLHRRFVLCNSRFFKTRLKALLYFLSPRLYYFINQKLKAKRKNK